MRAPKEKQVHHEWRCHRKYNWKGLNKKEKAEIRSLHYQTFIFTAVQTQVRRRGKTNSTKSKAVKLSTPSNLVHKLYKLKKKKKSLITFKIILSPYCEDSFLNQP